MTAKGSQYYLAPFTEQSWLEFRAYSGTKYGIKMNKQTRAKILKPGDLLLCYISKRAVFTGVLRITGPARYDEIPLYGEDIFPIRIDVKVVNAVDPDQGIPIAQLQNRLAIFRNLKNPKIWGGFFSNALNQFPEEDGAIIMMMMNHAVGDELKDQKESMPISTSAMLRRMHIQQALHEFPCLRGIVHNNENLYKIIKDNPHVSIDEREYLLGDVLSAFSQALPWYRLLKELDDWLALYPEYQTQSFGKKMVSNVFNFHAELEVFHHLRIAGLIPSLNPQVAKNSRKNLDFRIEIKKHPYLIEVFTPRMSQGMEAEFATGWAGYGDFERGIGPKNRGEYSRITAHITHEIVHHFSGIDSKTIVAPVILIMKTTYAYPEVMTGGTLWLDDELPEYIIGLLCYDSRRHNSHFYPNPNANIEEDTSRFFSGLMQPLAGINSGKDESQ